VYAKPQALTAAALKKANANFGLGSPSKKHGTPYATPCASFENAKK
jgi:hypothetical protein